MSTYVLMRILESAPRRYDVGMRLLTFGIVERSYDRLAAHVGASQRALDLGCGTGALALRMAGRGARVKAIDKSPEMLELAGLRARDSSVGERITWAEQGVAELDREADASYDVVASGLCFSELGDDELAYTLRHARRILVPGGLLLVADEVRPEGALARILGRLVRLPLAALAWLFTQQTTRAVPALAERIAAAGFELVETRRRGPLRDFAEIVARRPAGDTS